MIIKSSYANAPIWRDINVHPTLPNELKPLEEIAHNLWWVWNEPAIDLFKSINPIEWESTGKNPVTLLQNLKSERTEELVKDEGFLLKLKDVFAKFKNYMKEEPNHSRPSIAYFSMEYGLANILKIYSGGLGILAGDYLKEASDSNVDMTAVGFLYRYGYFTQSLSMDGQQIANYEAQNFGNLPIIQMMRETENL